MVDHALWLRFEQHRTRVDLNILGKLHGFVGSIFLHFCTMVEIAGCDAFSDIGALVVGVHR